MLLLQVLVILSAILGLIAITNCLFWRSLQPANRQFSELVSVLIPARNEEHNLPACLDSLLTQGSIIREILIYNDHSTDRTEEIIQKYVATGSSVHSIPAVALEAGWCGKNFACAQLAKKATGKWILFLDADSRLSPTAIDRMVAKATAENLSFLSCWPRFQMVSLAEKILMPFLNFVVFSLYPGILTYIKKPVFELDGSLGLAHGACMLFKREEYESFGGHRMVKDQIFEDTRISQLWRSSGRKGLCVDGREIISVRMYASLREIWLGFQKNFFPAFQSELGFWCFIALHYFLFFLPFILIFVSRYNFYLSFLAANALMIRILIVLRFGHSWLSIIFHPVGEACLLLLGISSWWRCKSGKGVIWKGREYQKSM